MTRLPGRTFAWIARSLERAILVLAFGLAALILERAALSAGARDPRRARA